MDFNESVIQIITIENISLLLTSPGYPHTYTSTHPHPHPYSSPNSYIPSPLLSSARHTRTLLDPYTPLKPNQTATLVKPYTIVKTVQRADHAQPRGVRTTHTTRTTVTMKRRTCFTFCWCAPTSSGNKRVFASVGFVCQWSETAPMEQVSELPKQGILRLYFL